MLALATGQAGQPQPNEKPSDPLSALYLFCVVHSNCILVFLRTGFGQEALGLRGLLSLVLLLVCIGGDPRMIWWVGAFLVAIIVQRIVTLKAIRKGAVIHSLYGGKPFMLNLPLIKKERDAMFMEMLLCFLLGALFLGISQFIGLFLMLGVLTLMIRGGIEESVFKRRLMRMQDAHIEGRYYGDSLRR